MWDDDGKSVQNDESGGDPVARDKKPPKLITSSSGSRSGSKWVIQAVVALVIVALIAIIGYNIAAKKKDKDNQTAAIAAAAAGPSVYHNGYLRLGNPNAKVVVSITEDFQCPICSEFEKATNPTIVKLIGEGKVGFDYRPIALLDQKYQGMTTYSARSGAAAACVAESDIDKWMAFHSALFAQQPAEGSPGPTDDQLAATAKQVGITDPGVAQCITSEKYTQFVTGTTNTALKEIQGTPTIKVNGAQITDAVTGIVSPADLLAAINKAQ